MQTELIEKDTVMSKSISPCARFAACGEGKNAVLFARNGYNVTAFDAVDLALDMLGELALAVAYDDKGILPDAVVPGRCRLFIFKYS